MSAMKQVHSIHRTSIVPALGLLALGCATTSAPTAPVEAGEATAAETVETVEATPAAFTGEAEAIDGAGPNAAAPLLAPKASPAVRSIRDDEPDTTALDLSYFNTQKWKRDFAQSFIARAETEPPISPEEAEALQRAVKAFGEGKKDRALKLLEGAAERFESANVQFLIGGLHFEAERFDEALVAYGEAVKAHDTFLRAWKMKALVHFQLASLPPEAPTPSDDPEAEPAPAPRRTMEEFRRDQPMHYRMAGDAFRKQLSLGGFEPQAYGFLGLTLMSQDRFLEAETAFRNAQLLEPEKSQWRTGLVSSLLRQRRFQEAATLLDQMLKEDPNNATYWRMQANAFLGLDQAKEESVLLAENAYRRAAENLLIVDQLGEADEASLSLVADIYANEGLSELAAESYLRAMRIADEPSPSRALRGAKLLLRSGGVTEAKAILDGVESILGDGISADDLTEVRKLQAQVAVRTGDGDEEIAILRKIVDENPMDGEAMVLLGAALGKKGALRAEDDEAKAANARLVAEAEGLFSTAATMDGQEADATLRHAQMLVRLKRYAEAIPLIKASLRAEDRDSVREYLEGVEKASKR